MRIRGRPGEGGIRRTRSEFAQGQSKRAHPNVLRSNCHLDVEGSGGTAWPGIPNLGPDIDVETSRCRVAGRWAGCGRQYHGAVPTRILLAWPRGYCAGVERAVDTVERALRMYGPPVYVRKQIVHNIHVVRDLEAKGAVFVEEESEVPEGGVVILSAHGVAPDVYENSSRRALRVIDATCPLVTKVHLEARRFARAGMTILLIGHEGHEEVIGTSGEAPDDVVLVGSPEEARTVEVQDPDHVSYLTQTTLSVDETNEIIEVLRGRFPKIQGPPREDIC